MVRSLSLLCLFCGLIICSCASLSTLQSPKVLEEGQAIGGVGFLAVPDEGEIGCCGVEAYARFPFFTHADFGIKVMGIPGFGTVTGDFKYQLFGDPLYVSLDLAYSYVNVSDLGSGSGIIPAVFIGTERIFGGAKIIYNSVELELFNSGNGDVEARIPGVFIGGVIGDKFRLLPVINVYFSPENDESIMIVNMGLEYLF